MASSGGAAGGAGAGAAGGAAASGGASASDARTAGNDAFKAGNYEAAVGHYSEGLRLLEAAGERNSKEQAALLSNRAECYLRLGKHRQVIDDATAALQADSSNHKALYRRAVAYEALHQLPKALEDLVLLVRQAPGNTAAIEAARRVRETLQATRVDRRTWVAKLVTQATEQIATGTGFEKAIEPLRGLASDTDLIPFLVEADALHAVWPAAAQTPATYLFLAALLAVPVGCAYVRAALPLDAICRNTLSATPELAVDALRLLSSLAAHSHEHGMPLSEADRNQILATIRECIGDNSRPPAVLSAALQSLVRTITDPAAAQEARALGVVRRMMTMLSADNKDVVDAALLALMRILSSLADTAQIQSTLEDVVPSHLKSEREVDKLRALRALNCALLVNRQAAEEVAKAEGIMFLISKCAFSPDAELQAVCADVLGALASDETGRALIDTHVKSALVALLSARATGVKSAAAITLAKLSPVKINDDDDHIMTLIDTVFDLVRSAADELDGTPTPTTRSIGAVSRAIEALSCMSSHTLVKHALTAHSDTFSALFRIAAAVASAIKRACAEHANAAEAKEWERILEDAAPCAFGICAVVRAVTVSNHRVRRERLREMEVSEEQWSKFEELTKSGAASNDPDTEDAVKDRITAFVTGPGLSAILALMDSIGILQQRPALTVGTQTTGGAKGGQHAAEELAAAFVHITEIVPMRGALVAAGAIPALARLERASTGKAVEAAAHSIAKILVTTNPDCLPNSTVMDCVAPLVRLCESDRELAQFESCMALTNIVTTGTTARRRVIKEKGIRRLEFLQFSENMMVRRAATEALANMVMEEEVLDTVSNRRSDLWLALADAVEDDVEVAQAAAGGLAMASDVPEAIERLLKAGIVPIMVKLLLSGKWELQRRAAYVLVAVANLADGRRYCTQPLEANEEKLSLQVVETPEAGKSYLTATTVLESYARGHQLVLDTSESLPLLAPDNPVRQMCIAALDLLRERANGS